MSQYILRDTDQRDEQYNIVRQVIVNGELITEGSYLACEKVILDSIKDDDEYWEERTQGPNSRVYSGKELRESCERVHNYYKNR